MKIAENNGNEMLLLANLVCKNSKIFNEAVEVNQGKNFDSKFYNNCGEIRITGLTKGKSFDDAIDGDITTIYTGKAHLGLNLYANFELIKNTGSLNAILIRTNIAGGEIERMLLRMEAEDYK